MSITHAGMIALVGQPNVGKSTLLNRLAGEKIAIVSPKPQTTRHRISAVVNRPPQQLVFMDTPGFHKPRNRLGEYMVKVVRDSTVGVDAVVLIVEPIASVGTPEKLLIERLRDSGLPVVLIINKIDTVPRENLLAVIDAYRNEMSFHDILPLSAKTGDGADLLIDLLAPMMPEGPGLFPEDTATDQTTRQIIGEIVREKILHALDREVPHGVAVVVESLKERQNGLIEIDVAIVCEKESHKGIVIGKGGRMLKKIGSEARAEFEEMYAGQVLLNTWVKIKENWRENEAALHTFGFDE